MNLTQKLFSILDTKTEQFMVPFTSQTTASAIRNFEAMSNNPESMVHAHPEDFCLFELGSFDTSSASFEIYAAPVSLGLAAAFITLTPVTPGE